MQVATLLVATFMTKCCAFARTSEHRHQWGFTTSNCQRARQTPKMDVRPSTSSRTHHLKPRDRKASIEHGRSSVDANGDSPLAHPVWTAPLLKSIRGDLLSWLAPSCPKRYNTRCLCGLRPGAVTVVKRHETKSCLEGAAVVRRAGWRHHFRR